MAGAPEIERERANVPALSAEASYGAFKLSLKIYDRWLVAAAGVGIAAFCIRNPQLVTDTIKKVFEVIPGIAVGMVRPGSILVELHCHTKKSFLLFMDDFKTKNWERLLNMEFEKNGYNEELEVTITNIKEANMHLEQLRGERVPAGKVKEEPGSGELTITAGNPPELSITLLETKKLKLNSVLWQNIELPIDILLLAVRDCEFLSCLSHLNSFIFKGYREGLGYVCFGDVGKDEESKLKIAVIKSSEGSAGPGGSLVSVKIAVAVLRPKAVINVGYCASLSSEKAKLGDVVVSASLRTYGRSKVTDDDIEDLDLRVRPNRNLLKHIKSINDSWVAPLKNPKELDVKVHCDGEFLSVNKTFQSRERCQQLIRRFPQSVAIETEGAGLFTAAHDLGIEWVIIKGISEYADGSSPQSDSWRRFASAMAASVTAKMLSETTVFQTWPHYEVPIKAGTPANEDLEELSLSLADKWNALGCRLGFEEARITAFHNENDKLSEKAFAMLMEWKQTKASKATYRVLYDALCDRLFVHCTPIAEKICWSSVIRDFNPKNLSSVKDSLAKD